MKTFYRIFVLICLFGITVFLKMDILSIYNVAPEAQSVCIGDINHDGFNDIVVGNEFNEATDWGGVCILRNLGWGYFAFTDSVYSYSNQWKIATANLDSVPSKEVLYSIFNPALDLDYIGIVFNGNVNDTVELNTHNHGGIDCIAAGDIDGNGYIDIIFASNQGLFWGIFYNYGNRNFSAPEIHHVTNYNPAGLAVGDLNNDGRDDVVLCGQIIDVYFSLPSGFQRLQLSAEGYTGDVAITDFDQDGYKDILGNSGLTSTILIKYKNNGNNTFLKLGDFVFQPGCGSFFIADFNNDGLPDVIYQTRNNEYGYFIWYNQGNFQLADSQYVSVPYIGGEVSRSFCCADLDNNGFPDIVTVRFSVARIHNVDIRFNDGNGNFGPNPIVGIQYHDPFSSLKLRNYPNPFQDETVFNFVLTGTSIAELSVFDLQGKFISCLINQKLEGGIHFIKWRGLDQDRQSCKPGAYIAYLKVNGKICQSIKLIKT